MKLAARPRCAALFEPPALTQALLEAQAAVALARAEAGLQSWASARAVEAARRLPDPVGPDLLELARLLQTRRALRLIEAEIFASARALLDLADAHGPRLPRPWLARGLDLLLTGVEPLRREAARLQLPCTHADPAVAAILARNLGLLPSPTAPSGMPSTLTGLLCDTHGAMAGLHEALRGLGAAAPLLSKPAPPEDEAEAERRLAHWRHRLPHLLPQAHGHDDPRLPAD
jgi:hypothetical protein